MSKQPEESWKEIGATIGAAVGLASYAHSKLTESKPAPSPMPVPPASVGDRSARDQADARVAIPFVCAVIAALGIAAVLLLPKPAAPAVRPVCEFAPVAAQSTGASEAAAQVPLNPPCRIPYNDGLTPGERLAGGLAVGAVKAVIFSIL